MTPLTCPQTGDLRAHLDGEAPEGIRSHLSSCQRCAAELDLLRSDAVFAAAGLALLEDDPLDAFLGGDAPHPARPSEPAPVVALASRRSARWARTARRFAAAAVAITVTAGVVATPAGREAAATFLSQFRSERVEVVGLDSLHGFNPLQVLDGVGHLESDDHFGSMEAVPTLAQAQRRTGLPIAAPDPATVPERFTDHNEILVSDAARVRLTFSEEDIATWAAEHDAAVEVPEGLADTTLVIDVPAFGSVTYRGPDWEQLVIGYAGTLSAHTEGALPIEDVRAFLLDLPGLPPGTVQQLRAMDDWRNTLPLPMPADQVTWRDVVVGGSPAVSLQGTSEVVSAVLWQHDGVIRGVGGFVTEEQALAIASGLR